ncbi:hypothetical protein ABE79_01590 [Proteus mirabilis]|nr:hypothetical protein ABE79_01590 [Proteus mirabilis]
MEDWQYQGNLYLLWIIDTKSLSLLYQARLVKITKFHEQVITKQPCVLNSNIIKWIGWIIYG